MADNVFPQYNSGTDPDPLSEDNLAIAFAVCLGLEPTVADGLTLSANYADNTVTISNGKAAIIAPQGRAYTLDVEQKSNRSLPESNGVNFVFLYIDLSADDAVGIHIDADDTPPSNPSVKIGRVDTSVNETTLLNRGGAGGGGVDISDSTVGIVVSGASGLTAGANLTAAADGDGTATIDATDTRVSIGNNGTTVNNKPSTLDFTTGLSATADGGGGVQVESVATGRTTVGPKTSDYTASNNETVLVDASGGSVAVTLPPSTLDLNVAVKKTDTTGNDVTVVPPSGEIDRSTQLSLSWNSDIGIGESVAVTGDGTNYWVV